MTKLELMLKYVSEHNDFYKKRIKEYGIKDPLDITQWPVLTRKELQENRYNMFSDGFRAKYYNQQLRRQSSSGSSGMPVNIYWDYKDWYASNLSLWRKRSEWYDILPTDRRIIFTLNAYDNEDGAGIKYTDLTKSTLLVNLSLLHDEDGYRKVTKIINTFDPHWLYIPPFALARIIDVYIKYRLIVPPSLKYIEAIGESINSDLKSMATKLFKTPVMSMYGSEEMNCIAYECPEGHMHILSDNVYLECLEDGNINHKYGEAIITSLNNHAMPLIRYNQNDILDLEESVELCQYDSRSQVIKKVLGRSYESIRLEHSEISLITLKEVIEEVNNEFVDAICEYRYEYAISKRILICYIIMKDSYINWFDSISKAIQKAFYNKVITDNILLVVKKTNRNFDMKSKHHMLVIKE